MDETVSTTAQLGRDRFDHPSMKYRPRGFRTAGRESGEGLGRLPRLELAGVDGSFFYRLGVFFSFDW